MIRSVSGCQCRKTSTKMCKLYIFWAHTKRDTLCVFEMFSSRPQYLLKHTNISTPTVSINEINTLKTLIKQIAINKEKNRSKWLTCFLHKVRLQNDDNSPLVQWLSHCVVHILFFKVCPNTKIYDPLQWVMYYEKTMNFNYTLEQLSEK